MKQVLHVYYEHEDVDIHKIGKSNTSNTNANVFTKQVKWTNLHNNPQHESQQLKPLNV